MYGTNIIFKQVFNYIVFALRYWLTIFFIGYCLSVNGRQKITHVPIDSLPNTFSIKGKVFPWMLLGSGINYTIGAEYGFRKVHAIGVDVVYNDMSSENEIMDTVTGDYKSGPRMYVVNRSIFLNYRRYLRYTEWRGNDFRPYLGVFARICSIDFHPQEGYKTDQVKYDEQQYSIGLLYGIVTPYNIDGLNLDFNMGPFWKWKTAQDVERIGGSDVKYDLRAQNFGWRIGLNIILVLKRGHGSFGLVP